MPDGNSIVYQKGLLAQPSLWRVSINGGEAVRLTGTSSKWGAVSNDGNRLLYFQMADGKWRFRIVPAVGGAVTQTIDVPAALTSFTVRWSPDDKSLFYINTIGSVGNLWQLPLDGSPVKQLTNFSSEALTDFAPSPDARRFAVTRAASFSDVVLIENEKQ